MRKILSSILVLAMVLGMVGTAFAATTTDVAGTSYETAVTRLNVLGILTGYPDGTFRPNNNITRAEFAAVAVRALGLEATAKATVGATQFKDVTASHWAAGYINVAVGKGVIKGYPDATFRPEANVTNAEAMAMLIRVLGYEPSVTGEWPMNYVSKAAEIGMTEGTALAPNTAAIRGDVAVLTSNSLTINLMEQSFYGTLTSYVVTNKTILTNKLNVTEVEGARVMNVAAYDRDTLKTNEVEVLKSGAIDTTTFTFSAAANMNALLGHKVNFWAKNGEIFYVVDKTAASKVATVTVNSNVVNEIRYTNAAGNAAHYDVAGSPKFFYNHAAGTWDDAAIDPTAAAVKAVATVIFNDAGAVDFVIAMQSDIVHFVTEIDTETPAISLKDQDDAEDDVALDALNYNVVDATDKVIALDAVKVGDVVYKYTDDNGDLWFKVISNVVSGEITKITTTADATLSKYKVYVGTTAYSLNANPASFDGDVYAAITTGNIYNLVGESGKFYLDAAGKIAVADTQAPTVSSTYAFVKTSPWDVGTSTGVTKYMKVVTTDGVTTTLAIDANCTIAGNVASGALIKYTINDAGAIKTMSNPALSATHVDGTAAVVNTTYNRITVAGKTYTVTADTKVFDGSAAGVPVKTTWATIEDTAGAVEVDVLANASFTSRADILIVRHGTVAGASADLVVLKYKYTDDDGLHFVVDAAGTEKDYIVNDSLAGAALANVTGYAYKEVATLTFNPAGEIVDVTETTKDVTAGVIATGKLDSTGGIVNLGGVDYFMTSDTVVYDVTDGVVSTNWAALKVGYTVDVYATAQGDGTMNIDAIVITDK